MARPSNTEERRAQITSALLKVMARRGYDGATIAEVGKVARLAPGVVHYHFKNKHEILLAVLQELAERHLGGLEQRLAAAGDEGAQAELDAFIDYHLGLGADQDSERLACWILLSGEALRDAKVRTQLEKVLATIAERLQRVLRGGVQQGVFACERVDVAASGLLALVQGYFVLAATARSLVPRGSAALAARQMAEGLLCGPQKRGRR